MSPLRLSPVKQEYIASRLEKGLSPGTIVKKCRFDQGVLSKWQSTRHIKDGTVVTRTIYLVRWRDFIKKSYREAGITDIHGGVANTAEKFKQNTRRGMIAVLKQFLQWT
jgi:hypothetical protein